MAERRIMTVVGARPQFVKAAMLSRALAAAGLREILVHTGQHYDDAMSGSFFRDLGLPDPAVNLGVGSASHGVQTARMLEGLERVMQEQRPDVVVVFGDTNSTLAGALAASKLGIHIAHVEAGMRCGDLKMPEEINRVMTDAISDLLLCANNGAADHLRHEGIDGSRVHVVGDLMVDACLSFAPSDPSPFLARFGVQQKQFVFATIHRAENTEDPRRLRQLADALDEVAARLPVVFCAHPRTRAKLAELSWQPKYLQLAGPADYQTALALSRAAAVVATDSGGIQKEASILGTPVVVLRDRTEWIELVETGWCSLMEDPTRLAALVLGSIDRRGQDLAERYGCGRAAAAMAVALARG